MKKIYKIRWLTFLLSNDGLPEGFLDLDTADPLIVYTVLLMLKRLRLELFDSRDIALDVALSVHIENAKEKYNYTKNQLEEYYNEYLFDWEKTNKKICDVYC